MRKKTTMASFLTRSIWLSALPMLLLDGWLTFLTVRSLYERRGREAERLARSLVAVIDQNLDAQIRALGMLSLSPLIDDTTRWSDLYREAQNFRTHYGNHVILSDVGDPMRMLLNTRVPYGATLPLLPRPTGKAAAPIALETGKPAIGDSFVGPIANQLLIAVAVPVLRDGKTVHLLLSTVDGAHLQALWERMSVPEGWSARLRDGPGQTLAALGLWETERIGGSDDKRFLAGSSMTPWSVEVRVPEKTFFAVLYDAAIVSTAFLAVVVAAGLIGNLIAGRRLSAEVASLSRPSPQRAREPRIAEIAAARDLIDRTMGDLRESEERFRRLFISAPVAMGLGDRDGNIILRNAQFDRLFGYPEKELRTFEDWWRLTSPHPGYREEMLGVWNTFTSQRGDADSSFGNKEYRVIRKDGEERFVLISGLTLTDGLIGVFFDITEQRRAEERIRRNLREKDTLLQELYHRTNNNMQRIQAMMHLQAAMHPEESLADFIRETERRIGSMALVHGKLFKAEDLSRLNPAEYVRDLAEQTLGSYPDAKDRVALKLELADFPLIFDAALPMGLALHELLTNSLKHAFPGGRSGRIEISLSRNAAGEIELRIADDGIGFPESFDIDRDASFGLQLVSALVGQLHGVLSVERGSGARYLIRFKDDLYGARV